MTVAAWLFTAEGVLLAGIEAFFLFVRPPLLPEDVQFLGRSSSKIDELLPQLRTWLRRVFTVLGAQALAAGGLSVFVAVTDVRQGDKAAVVALALAGAASIGLMAAVNFAIRSDFRWMLRCGPLGCRDRCGALRVTASGWRRRVLFGFRAPQRLSTRSGCAGCRLEVRLGPQTSRYPAIDYRVRSSMRLFTAALVVPMVLVAGCTTSHSAVQIDYTDFVKLGGVTYQAAWISPARPMKDADLGPVYGKVKVKLEGSQDPNHQLQDGDSAFLAPGTQVYGVTGYQPTFRLAARHDGRLTLYEADTNPGAKAGADLLDLANKVQYIGVNSTPDGHTELAAIKDPKAVRALVDLVEKSPVDQSNQPVGGVQYFVDFHMLDGTEVIRSYWPDSGELARGIGVPTAFRATIAAAIQSVSAGAATPSA